MLRWRPEPKGSTAIAGLIFAGVLLVTAGRGPDFGRYIDWALAFESGDIDAIHGAVGSPLGIPVTQWSPGPGLFFALGHAATLGLADLNHSAYVVGWLAAVGFWCAFARLLHRAADGDRLLVLLGLVAAFVGTGAGFYSFQHASESLTLALVAGLLLLAVEPLGGAGRQGVAVGIAAAALLLVRSNLGFYALPAIAVSLRQAIRADAREPAFAPATDSVVRQDRAPAHGSFRARALAGLGLALPVALAVLCLATVNRWMTGSPSGSAYLFGDAAFSSLDLANPALTAVLLHPLHGLLAYHPLHLIGFGAALLLLRHPRERLVWAVGLGLVCLHLWIQAGWYVWWMGMVTFGTRGLLPVGIVLVAAIVRLLARAREGPAADDESASARAPWAGPGLAGLLIASIGAACLWSFLLLVQGESHFYSMSELWSAQLGTAADLSGGRSVLLLLLSLPLGWVTVSGLREGAGRDRMEGMARWTAIALVSLALWYGLHRIAIRPPAMALRAGALCAGFVAVGAVVGSFAGRASKAHRAKAVDASLLAAAIVLAVGLSLFVRLAARTSELIQADTPAREFAYRAPFQVEEVLESYCEYLAIRGFEARKMALRGFLARNDVAIDCSFMQPVREEP